MTCIVGVQYHDTVLIGADSASVDGWELTIPPDPKVFHRGPFLIGYTTSWRMGQLLRYRLDVPDHPVGVDDHEYLATLFVDAVRDCLKAGGFAKKENEAETGGEFLVAYRGGLYVVQSEYQVLTAPEYMAVGAGGTVALGALCAGVDFPPLMRVEQALKAAERHSIGVRGPWVIETQERVTSNGHPLTYENVFRR